MVTDTTMNITTMATVSTVTDTTMDITTIATVSTATDTTMDITTMATVSTVTVTETAINPAIAMVITMDMATTTVTRRIKSTWN